MMKLTTTACVAAIAGALLAGCAAQGGGGSYFVVTENIARIKVGATTSKQVEELLGKPAGVVRNDRRGWDAWEFKVLEYGQRSTLWVSFSSDGVVREVIQLRDKPYPGTT